MAHGKVFTEGGVYEPAQPAVYTIGPGDLKDALARGISDFNAMPTHLAFLCVIYPLVTLVFARTYAGLDVLPLVFPLLSGYTLVGPLVALGMYELSRRHELGLDISRQHAFDVFKNPSIINIAALGLMLMVIYFVWIGTAKAIYVQNFGDVVPQSVAEFVHQVFATQAGLMLIIVGSGVGFIFSVVVFTLSVVSFPMLLDREVSIMTAVRTSVRVVFKNPITMAIWGFIIASSLLLGALPFFVGLAVVLPVLGHASWHLYRRVVGQEGIQNDVGPLRTMG